MANSSMDDYHREQAYKEVGGKQDWDEGGRVHNWRNYVGPHTRGIWRTLTREQRVGIAMDAMDRALEEEWD